MTYTKQGRRIIGIIIVVATFFLSSYMDNHLFVVGEVFATDSFKGWLTDNDWIICLPLMLGMGFLIWDTKLIQEPWL